MRGRRIIWLFVSNFKYFEIIWAKQRLPLDLSVHWSAISSPKTECPEQKFHVYMLQSYHEGFERHASMLQIVIEMRKGQSKGTIISINLLSAKSIFLFPLWHLFEETLQNSIWIQANTKKEKVLSPLPWEQPSWQQSNLDSYQRPKHKHNLHFNIK